MPSSLSSSSSSSSYVPIPAPMLKDDGTYEPQARLEQQAFANSLRTACAACADQIEYQRRLKDFLTNGGTEPRRTDVLRRHGAKEVTEGGEQGKETEKGAKDLKAEIQELRGRCRGLQSQLRTLEEGNAITEAKNNGDNSKDKSNDSTGNANAGNGQGRSGGSGNEGQQQTSTNSNTAKGDKEYKEHREGYDSKKGNKKGNKK